MSGTIADKLTSIAQNEQRVYRTGYDKGYEVGYDKGAVEGGGAVVSKPEVEGNYTVNENGDYAYIPPEGKVFNTVSVKVAVPSDSKEEESGHFEVTENGEYSFSPSSVDKVFSLVRVDVNVPTSSGGDEGVLDTSFSFTTGGTTGTCYCPPHSEGGMSYGMMEFDTTYSFLAFAKWSPVSGTRYKIICNPMGELWETFIFGASDYSSTVVRTDNASVGQYVQQINSTTFIVTIPPNCANFFVNFNMAGGAVAFLLD